MCCLKLTGLITAKQNKQTNKHQHSSENFNRTQNIITYYSKCPEYIKYIIYKNYLTYRKIKENLTISQKSKQLIDVNPEITQRECSDRDYKAVIITILPKLKVNILEVDEKQMRNR